MTTFLFRATWWHLLLKEMPWSLLRTPRRDTQPLFVRFVFILRLFFRCSLDDVVRRVTFAVPTVWHVRIYLPAALVNRRQGRVYDGVLKVGSDLIGGTTALNECRLYLRYAPTAQDAQDEVVREWQIAHGLIDPNAEKGKKKRRWTVPTFRASTVLLSCSLLIIVGDRKLY